MTAYGFTKTEKAQCVLWSNEGYGGTAVQHRFQTKFNKSARSRDLEQF